MNIQFQYPEALWLLGLIPLFIGLLFFYTGWKKRTAKRMGHPELVQRLYSFSFTKFKLKAAIILIAFALGCIAAANPRRPDATEAQVRKGMDIVMALDVSNSMLATDISPSRLVAAKTLIINLLNSLPDDRIGFVVFAGNAYVQVPLTFDKESVAAAVTAAQTGSAGTQGTSIGDALAKSALALKQDEDRFKAILLLTDGETHDEAALQTAKELAANGILIHTVGVGSAQGATIKDATGAVKKDEAGNVVITKLDEAVLQQIAAATKGAYVHLQNSEAATAAVLQQFTSIEKKAVADASSLSYQTLYRWAAAPAFLLLIIELFISDRKKTMA